MVLMHGLHLLELVGSENRGELLFRVFVNDARLLFQFLV